MAPVAAICSPNPREGQVEHPLPVRVAAMAAWLLWGMPMDTTLPDVMDTILAATGATGSPSIAGILLEAEAAVVAHRRDLAAALADGRVTVSTEGPVAVVRGLHVGATGIGYSQADVLVAEQVDPCILHVGPRKVTIAWRIPGLVDRDALCAALNAAEVAARGPGPTWGGPATLLGSPDGGSILPLADLASIASGHMRPV